MGIETLSQDVINKLESMAIKLGTTVEHLFGVITQETVTKSFAATICYGSMSLILAVCTIVFMNRTLKAINIPNRQIKSAYENKEVWTDEKVAKFTINLVLSGSFMISAAALCHSFTTYFIKWLSPTTVTLEYFANLLK
jgi:hypothetical protein